MKTKSAKKPNKKTIHKRVWRLMSEYIRLKGADSFGYNTCYTCGVKKHYKELQAGHYKHDKLDFDERNLKPQCIKCNHFHSGKLDVYSEKLTKEYGVKWVEKLVKDAWAYRGYEIDEMLKIEQDLKVKIEWEKSKNNYNLIGR